MAELIRIPLQSPNVADAIQDLAPRVDPMHVRVPVEEKRLRGSWIRFEWLLSDGTSVWEGVGKLDRCVAAPADRPGVGGYDAVLTDLTFDPRNEAMYERILLSTKHPTGAPDPGASFVEVEVAVAVAPPADAPAPAPAQAVKKPRYASRPPPAGDEKHRPAARTAASKGNELKPKAKLNASFHKVLRPKPRSLPPMPKRTVEPRDRPTQPLEVPGERWKKANSVMRRLNLKAPSLAKGRWTEERVLQMAVKMGLEALDALTEKGE
jgi:hypothetical protein